MKFVLIANVSKDTMKFLKHNVKVSGLSSIKRQGLGSTQSWHERRIGCHEKRVRDIITA